MKCDLASVSALSPRSTKCTRENRRYMPWVACTAIAEEKVRERRSNNGMGVVAKKVYRNGEAKKKMRCERAAKKKK